MGNIKFENTSKIYQPTGMTLSAAGMQNYNNDLIQTITYNENNDPTLITGQKAKIGFEYGLTNMRQRMDISKPQSLDPIGEFSVMQSSENDGGVWDPNAPIWQNSLSKFYSEDGSFEVVKIARTGQEKHILYIGGSPYESNIIYLKDYGETTGSYKYLHKDYLGSILVISDEAGNKLEQRHYDAWGNFTHLKVGNGTVVTDKATILNLARGLLIDRGYTSHEHLLDVGLIHMNGRLYDPLLRRFLNADENIQDPNNTQIYNKYGYAVNNPLMYNDPSGEVLPFLIGVGLSCFWATVISGAIVGAAISMGIYILQATINNNFSLGGFVKSFAVGAVTGAVSAGVGQIFEAGGFFTTVAQGALTSSATNGVSALITGDNFLKGLIKGAVIGGGLAGISWVISKTVAYYRSKTPNTITSSELKNAGYDISDDINGDYYKNDQQVQNDFNRTTGDYQASVENINTEYKVATNQNLPEGHSISQPANRIITDNPKEPSYILGITKNRNKNWWEFLVKGGKTTVLIAPNLGIQSDAIKQAVFGHEYIHAYHRYIGLVSQYGKKYSDYTESSAYHFTINLLKAQGQDFSGFVNRFYNYGGKFPGPFNWTYAIKNIVNFKK